MEEIKQQKTQEEFQTGGVAQSAKIEETGFIDEQGKMILPSLLTEEETISLGEVSRNYHRPDYISIESSVRARKMHYTSLDYNATLANMTYLEEFLLKFIANFNSVQKLQVYRQCWLFRGEIIKHREGKRTSKNLSEKEINKALNHLEYAGLILANTFKDTREGREQEKLTAYTLDVPGFRFMKNYWGSSVLVNDPDVFFLNSNNSQYRHLRCWEIVDVYQMLQAMPTFKGFTTGFSGLINPDPSRGGPLVYSLFQASLQLKGGVVFNFVCYPCTQLDSPDFFKAVYERWTKWINSEPTPGVYKPVNTLLSGVDTLAFIVPDRNTANYMNTKLKVYEIAQQMPVMFITLEEIKKHGIEKAFLWPAEQEYIESENRYSVELEPFTFIGLMDKESDGESNE